MTSASEQRWKRSGQPWFALFLLVAATAAVVASIRSGADDVRTLARRHALLDAAPRRSVADPGRGAGIYRGTLRGPSQRVTPSGVAAVAYRAWVTEIRPNCRKHCTRSVWDGEELGSLEVTDRGVAVPLAMDVEMHRRDAMVYTDVLAWGECVPVPPSVRSQLRGLVPGGVLRYCEAYAAPGARVELGACRGPSALFACDAVPAFVTVRRTPRNALWGTAQDASFGSAARALALGLLTYALGAWTAGIARRTREAAAAR